MFLNPIASTLDETIYSPANHYKIYDVDLFWKTVEYNNNLFKLFFHSFNNNNKK